MRPGGEFGAALEPASLSGSTQLLTGPEQNLWALGSDKKPTESPVQIIWRYSQAVNTFRTFFCEAGVPEKWVISCVSDTGVRLLVWNGPQGSGDAIILAGGGTAVFEAQNEFCTIQSLLGTPVGNVIALRKMKAVINPGNLA